MIEKHKELCQLKDKYLDGVQEYCTCVKVYDAEVDNYAEEAIIIQRNISYSWDCPNCGKFHTKELGEEMDSVVCEDCHLTFEVDDYENV